MKSLSWKVINYQKIMLLFSLFLLSDKSSCFIIGVSLDILIPWALSLSLTHSLTHTHTHTDDDDSTSKLYPLNIFLSVHLSYFHSKNENRYLLTNFKLIHLLTYLLS